MKIKEQLITGCLAAMILLVQCSKPSDFSSNYVRGEIDGVTFECTNVQANKPEAIPGAGSDPTLRITGQWPSHSLKLVLHNSGSSLSVGSYIFNGLQMRNATIVHNGTESYYAGDGGLFNPIPLYGTGQITILQISSRYVKGTFEFVTAVNSSTAKFKTVTSGEFYIKRG